jgi:hypothetical protein
MVHTQGSRNMGTQPITCYYTDSMLYALTVHYLCSVLSTIQEPWIKSNVRVSSLIKWVITVSDKEEFVIWHAREGKIQRKWVLIYESSATRSVSRKVSVSWEQWCYYILTYTRPIVPLQSFTVDYWSCNFLSRYFKISYHLLTGWLHLGYLSQLLWQFLFCSSYLLWQNMDKTTPEITKKSGNHHA